MNIFFSIVITLFLSYSCIHKEDKQVMCTMEFRTIGLEVNGDSLQEFYTIRLKTNDTLTFDNSLIYNNYYTVLDDSYSPILKNSTETFLFNGLIGDSIVVSELFSIAADECHIYKISGAEKIEI